jgi:hypothetical protein
MATRTCHNELVSKSIKLFDGILIATVAAVSGVAVITTIIAWALYYHRH